jgi:outer membrane murein-binding lipoprotein Lpp
MTPGGIPAPPFQDKRPKVDKADPFASMSAEDAPAQKPQEIKLEINQEMQEQAQKSSRTAAIISGVIGAVVFGALGFVWGGQRTQGSFNNQAVAAAGELATDIEKTTKDIKTIADKLDAANKSLFKDKKFPEALAGELKGITLSFDATNLAGKNTSRFKPQTQKALIDFTRDVSELDARRDRIARMFDANKKDIVALLESAEKPRMSYAVFTGKAEKGAVGTFVRLKDPIEFGGTWPDKFLIKGQGEDIQVERFKSGEPFIKAPKTEKEKPTIYAIPIEPDGIAKVFPNEIAKRVEAELSATMLLIAGTPTGTAAADDEKVGVLKTGEDLVKDLRAIGGTKK